LKDAVDYLDSTPVAVVAVNFMRRDAHLLLPAGRAHTDWEQQQVLRAQHELEQAMAVDRVASLLAAEALPRGIPPRPMAETLRNDFERSASRLLQFGVGAVALGGWALRRWFRRRPRDCGRCGPPRRLLDEAADDAHLTDGQRTEERVKSVDCGVWWCEPCNDALVLDSSRWFSGHSRCPSCRNRTRRSCTTTIHHAPEQSEGRLRIDEACEHCPHQNSFERTTAQLTRSSSSSIDSSASSSFGGGGSSGGGSSSSW
jgi:uncharacterized membrane protein YgcG